MATLCIDTATPDGMVVVARDDGARAAECWRSSGRHGEDLFGHIEAALREAEVARDEIALIGVNIGPGGFTSLRVGLATAKGLALGLGLPLVGVSSLRVAARAIDAGPEIVRVPVMSSYRGEVFAAAYALEGEELAELVPPTLGDPDGVLPRVRAALGERPVIVRTDGPTPDALLEEVRLVHRADGPADLARLEPAYLRPSDAKLPEQPLRTEHSS